MGFLWGRYGVSAVSMGCGLWESLWCPGVGGRMLGAFKGFLRVLWGPEGPMGSMSWVWALWVGSGSPHSPHTGSL